MGEVEEIPGEEPDHPRPLPSVDMPLLRAQRRAFLARRVLWAILSVLLLAAGGTAAAWMVLRARSEPGNARATSLPAGSRPRAAALPMADGGARDGPRDSGAALGALGAPGLREETPTLLGADTRVVRRFGQARGFRDALSRDGSTHEECVELEHALRDVMDFRRCRPQDRMVFERDASGRVLLFEYHGGSLTSYYQATRDDRGRLRGERVEIPIERRRTARAGVVRTSLGEALERLGFGHTLAGVFIEAFEGRVNFQTDARTGDTFKIIVDEERVSNQFLRWGQPRALEYAGTRTGTLRAFYFEPRGERGDYYDATGRGIHGGWLRTPVRYDHISSRFDLHRMHPILHRRVPHNGVDYAAPAGTPVYAAADGTVTFAGNRGANGNLVSLRHDGGYETHYAHLTRVARGIRAGVEVRQRQLIGYVGSTGRSTGPHLHFGLKHGGRFADPLAIIDGPGRMMPSRDLGRFRRTARRLSEELRRLHARGSTPQGPSPAEPLPPAEEPMD